MPANVDELVQLLDLEEIERDLFRGRQPDTQLQRVFGGQVLAQALMAATRTTEPERIVHSLHSYFLRPGDTAVPIVYAVEDLRDGRTFATRRVIARQHGRPIFVVNVSFQTPEEGMEHEDVMPVVTAPEDCVDPATRASAEDKAEWQREWSALEVRHVADTRDGGSLDPTDSPARAQWWLRVNGDLPVGPQWQLTAFTYATDMTLLPVMLIPHGLYVTSPGLMSASLDHVIWFHRPIRADRWWFYDQTSPAATGGRGLALARVFQDGHLVATIAQEGLIRRAR